MIKNLKLISLVLLSIGIITSCKRENTSSHLLESEYVKYNVVYLNQMAGDIPTSMLPDMMETYYTKNLVMLRIQGFFGQFSLTHIANLKKQTVISTLNFFGNKVYYQGKKGELPVGVKELENLSYTFTEDQMTISGLNSKKVKVSTSIDTFDVYYTTELETKTPNITTTYPFIEHILTDFKVELSMLNMRMILKEHESVPIESSIFQVPEDYKEVSQSTMESIINSLFTKE